MPKFIYQPEDSIPQDTYRVKFLGSLDKDPFEGASKFGKGQTQNERRYEWQFEVADGPYRGVLLTQNTGQSPRNPLSGCYQMISWLLGRSPQEREPIDTDTFIGRIYEAEWKINPRSDAKRCHIAHMKPLGGNSQATPAPRPAPAAQPVRKGAATHSH